MHDHVEAIDRLEQGEILILPGESFSLMPEEQAFLRPHCVKPGTKGIKFSPAEQRIWGMAEHCKHSTILTDMFRRYTLFAQALVGRLLPGYASAPLITSHASFRPVEAEGRVQSKRHDDRLLHVDAFPSRPVHGKRILRVFTNIHPSGRPRVWNTGEPFTKVAKRFLPHIKAPQPEGAALLKWLGITKEKRSPYDHYMLHIHDRMKRDDTYQETVSRSVHAFPAGSSWIVFSDQVSHAALSGQHALEQTFLLPPEAMHNPSLSPLRVLETLKNQALV